MEQPEIKDKAKKKIGDVILVLSVIAVAVIMSIVFFLENKNTKADSVLVKVDGKVVYSEPLSVDKDMNIEAYAGGHNIVRIQGGKVRMIDADCPDKVCVHTGEISRVGQTIVCLPHKLVVEIVGSTSEDTIDSLVK